MTYSILVCTSTQNILKVSSLKILNNYYRLLTLSIFWVIVLFCILKLSISYSYRRHALSKLFFLLTLSVLCLHVHAFISSLLLLLSRRIQLPWKLSWPDVRLFACRNPPPPLAWYSTRRSANYCERQDKPWASRCMYCRNENFRRSFVNWRLFNL